MNVTSDTRAIAAPVHPGDDHDIGHTSPLSYSENWVKTGSWSTTIFSERLGYPRLWQMDTAGVHLVAAANQPGRCALPFWMHEVEGH